MLILMVLMIGQILYGQVTLDKIPKSADYSVVKNVQSSYPLLQAVKPNVSIMQYKVLELPQGLHDSDAFFCRIEDAIAKQNKVNFKFRLGSVDYVDAMEGKGYFQAVSYSRATNFFMQYKEQQ